MVIGFVGNVTNKVGQGAQITVNAVGQGIKAAFDTNKQVLAFVGGRVGQGLAYFGQGISNTGKALGNGYNQLADNAPGIAKTILTGIENGVGAIVSTANTVVIANKTIVQKTGSVITKAGQNAVNGTKKAVARATFKVGEKLQDVSGTVGIAIMRFGSLFVAKPTTITDVQIAILSSTSAKISWVTNHPANGKVNYGLDRTYPFDVQSEKRVTHHEFILTDLQPNTTYYFEVMSHNKNYVYDANREFTTLP